jgi:hypothetical protein
MGTGLRSQNQTVNKTTLIVQQNIKFGRRPSLWNRQMKHRPSISFPPAKGSWRSFKAMPKSIA